MGYFADDAGFAVRSSLRGLRFASDPNQFAEDRSPFMSLLLAAIGATVAALFESTLVPYLTVGNANLHPVLVIGVIWTIAAGIERGIAWAFVGGLVLDILLGRPLGASAFALLVAVGGATLIAQPLPRLRTLAPIVAVPLLSLVYSLLVYILTSAGQGPGAVADPIGLFVPGALYDGLLGMVLGPLVVSIRDRRAVVERVDW
jgi:rod shape-determining protein MreD